MGNILLTNGIAKLADFGLAIKYKEDVQIAMCGTPNFLAPEVILTKKHCPASDIWAFGCVLFCMLAGDVPFRYTNMRETGERIKKCQYKIPNFISKESVDCIEKILIYAPEKRLSPYSIIKHPCFMKYQNFARKAPMKRPRSGSDYI